MKKISHFFKRIWLWIRLLPQGLFLDKINKKLANYIVERERKKLEKTKNLVTNLKSLIAKNYSTSVSKYIPFKPVSEEKLHIVCSKKFANELQEVDLKLTKQLRLK